MTAGLLPDWHHISVANVTAAHSSILIDRWLCRKDQECVVKWKGRTQENGGATLAA